MSKTMVREREKVAAALEALAGDYRITAATRNMLLVVTAMLVPLLVLIVVRLLSNAIAPILALVLGGLVGMIALGFVADFMLGGVGISPLGIERRSPWPWLAWRVSADEVHALGTERMRNGRHLLIEGTNGHIFRLPFRSGFERVLPLID